MSPRDLDLAPTNQPMRPHGRARRMRDEDRPTRIRTHRRSGPTTIETTAARLGLPIPPPCEFYGEPDDSAVDRDIDEMLGWLYGVGPATEGQSGEAA